MDDVTTEMEWDQGRQPLRSAAPTMWALTGITVAPPSRSAHASRGRVSRRPAVAVLPVLLLVTACSSPAQRFSDHAMALGLASSIIEGNGFRHVVYGQTGRPSGTLHVYVDGDGTPWRRGRPAADPTPRSPLVLDLMALDPGPRVYLGRPCYHGLSDTPPCSSALWTAERYSEAVVSSMAAAARRILREAGFHRVAWFGYSGGGALAILLAPRLSETVGVVTVAANLDIQAWADFHGYPRLEGSLNPAAQPSLGSGIYQRHYVGGRDQVVPREIVVRGPVAPESLLTIAAYDHRCCWREIWPAILNEFKRWDERPR